MQRHSCPCSLENSECALNPTETISTPSSPQLSQQIEFKSSNPFKDNSARACSKSPELTKTTRGSRGSSPCDRNISSPTNIVVLKDLKRASSFNNARKDEIPTMVAVKDVTDTVPVVKNQEGSGCNLEDNKTLKESFKEKIKPHSMDISPWLVSSDVVTGSTKTKEATIIRKSVITTQL